MNKIMTFNKAEAKGDLYKMAIDQVTIKILVNSSIS